MISLFQEMNLEFIIKHTKERLTYLKITIKQAQLYNALSLPQSEQKKTATSYPSLSG